MATYNINYEYDASVSPSSTNPTTINTNQIVSVGFQIGQYGLRMFDVRNAVVVGFDYGPDNASVTFWLSNPLGNVTIYIESASDNSEKIDFICLYNNIAEPNRVDKRLWLKNDVYVSLLPNAVRTNIYEGKLRQMTSITSLTMTVQWNSDIAFPYNYIFIPNFRRYYFITDITNIGNNIWELTCQCDVLMSFREGILNTVGMVDRNEKFFNPNIVDDKLVVSKGYKKTVDFIDNDVFKQLKGTSVDFEDYYGIAVTGFTMSTYAITESEAQS